MPDQKLLLGKFSFDWVWLILAACLTSSGSLCLKQSRLDGKGFLSPFFFASMALYGINFLAYSKSLDRLPVSMAYPLFSGLAFVLLAVFSHIFFREALHMEQWIGMAFILAGLALLFRV
jgi:multidrug transporter EmrE-like cation transporter